MSLRNLKNVIKGDVFESIGVVLCYLMVASFLALVVCVVHIVFSADIGIIATTSLYIAKWASLVLLGSAISHFILVYFTTDELKG